MTHIKGYKPSTTTTDADRRTFCMERRTRKYLKLILCATVVIPFLGIAHCDPEAEGKCQCLDIIFFQWEIDNKFSTEEIGIILCAAL